MSEAKYSWARLLIAKQRLQIAIDAYTSELAMLEILAVDGGEMKALELASKLIARFDKYEKDPQVLCKSMGFAPDEVVSIERFL